MRWALCSDAFDDRPLDAALAAVAESGYQGVELAPYMLGGDPTGLPGPERAQLRRRASDLGLGFTGLHWLLARTDGLHVASSEPGTRRRTLDRLVGLSVLCADLGGSVLVFGSPGQRSTPEGMSRSEARRRATDMFRDWAEAAADTGTTICLESLPPDETDFMNTVADAATVARAVDHPSVGLVLDVKSMSSEGGDIGRIVAEAAPLARYVQANDADRGGPGFGRTDFVGIFEALRDIKYRGDVSVEAFDFSPGRERVAVESLSYLKTCATRAGWPDGAEES